MHCIVFHNPSAGWRSHSRGELASALNLAGHTYSYCSTKEDDLFAKLIQEPADFYVAAGGDGTVAKVMLAMPDHDIPLAILPLGTANNIARSLRVLGSPVDLPETWTLDRLGTFNVGVAHGPWGSKGFAEGFGVGPFAETLEIDPKGRGPEQLQAGRKVLAEMMGQAEPLDLTVTLDGVPLAGDLLSLEITSIAYIGPGLPLAPASDPADKALEVVAVEAERRDEMVSWLKAPRSEPPVIGGRGRRISLTTKGAPLRLDDSSFDAPDEEVAITIEFGWSIKILKGHC